MSVATRRFASDLVSIGKKIKMGTSVGCDYCSTYFDRHPRPTITNDWITYCGDGCFDMHLVELPVDKDRTCRHYETSYHGSECYFLFWDSRRETRLSYAWSPRNDDFSFAEALKETDAACKFDIPKVVAMFPTDFQKIVHQLIDWCYIYEFYVNEQNHYYYVKVISDNGGGGKSFTIISNGNESLNSLKELENYLIETRVLFRENILPKIAN